MFFEFVSSSSHDSIQNFSEKTEILNHLNQDQGFTNFYLLCPLKIKKNESCIPQGKTRALQFFDLKKNWAENSQTFLKYNFFNAQKKFEKALKLKLKFLFLMKKIQIQRKKIIFLKF